MLQSQAKIFNYQTLSQDNGFPNGPLEKDKSKEIYPLKLISLSQEMYNSTKRKQLRKNLLSLKI